MVITNLEIEIEAVTKTASEGIDSFVKSLGRLNRALSASKIQKLTGNFQALNNAIKVLDSGQVAKIMALGDALEKVSNATGAFKVSNIKKLQKATKAIKNGGLEKGTRGSETQTESTASQFENLSSRIRGALNKATYAVFDFAGKVGSAFAKVAGAVGSVIGRLAKIPINRIKNMAKSFNDLFRSLKRIAVYRALRSLIKAITEGFTEGIQAVSRYSRSVGGEFAQTMDALASKMALVKGSVGAMSAPFIELFAPAIQAVTNAVITLINSLNQLFSILGGKGGWLKATSAVQKYDDAVGGASKSQDKLTAGIDELNILSETAGGGGGGAGEAQYDFAPMEFEGWAKRIKDAIDNGDWIGAGKALADHLNGLFENWDATEAGRTLGKKIEQAIEFSYGFWSNLNTQTLGSKLSDFFNSAMNEINAELLGATFAEKWNRVVDLIYGFVTGFEWNTLGSKIGDWVNGAFENFNFGKLATTMSSFVTGVLDSIASTFSTIRASSIVDGIFDFFSHIDWEGLGTGFGKALSSTISFGLDFVNSVLEKLNGQPLGNGLFDFIDKAIQGIDYVSLGEKLGLLGLNIVELALTRTAPSIIATISNIVAVMEHYGVEVPEWIKAVPDAWDKGVNTITGQIDILKGKITEHEQETISVEEAISRTTKEMCDNSSEAYKGLSENIQASIESAKSGVESSMSDVQSVIENHSMASADAIREHFERASEEASINVENIKTVASATWGDIRFSTTEEWINIQNTVINVWKHMKSEAETHFGEIKNLILEKWQNIEKDAIAKWGEAGTITSAVHSALTIMTNVFTATFIGENNIESMVTNAFAKMEQSIRLSTDHAFTTIDTFVSKTINRIDDLIRKLEELENAENSADIDTGGYVNSGQSVRGYASGGVVTSGSLFFARENGIPELVGNFGGTTGVMNNEQIVEAVSVGVANAVASVMGGFSGGDQNFNIYLSGKQLQAEVRKTTQRQGASVATGGIYNSRFV